MEKKHKITEAQSVYERMIEIFFYGKPIEDLNKIVNKSFIGYGTAAHEFFVSIHDLIKMAETQSEQLKNHPVEITRKPILSKSLRDGASYLIVEEFQMHDRKNDYRYKARLSAILEKIEEKWLVTHFHGSTPDSNVSEEESLPMEGLRRKNLELEEKIKERTRELEIEAALEKVRSRSLAMHTTHELGEVVTVIVEKLTDLGVVLDANGVILCTYFPDSKDVLHWIVSPDYSFGRSYLLPYFEHPIFKEVWESKESGEAYFSKAFSVEDKNSFFEYAFVHSDYKHFPDDFKKWVFQNDKHILSFAWQKNSAILIPSHTGVVPTDDDVTILKRFANVFEQAYTRFLDLQKAETQTREAKIEATLERVRSRSMAMHKSDELKEVIQVVYDQLVQLQIAIDHAGFILDYKENEGMHIWLADHNAVFPKIVLPYFDCAHWNNFIEAKKTGQNFFTNQLGFEEKNKFYKDLFQFIPDLPEETKTTYFGIEGLAISTVLLDNVGLYIENYNGNPFSDEENAILMRFGKVFQQTYTRFLDLQKAEAQAKEAQIEAALERVRSQSMGMQSSTDFSAVTTEMFNQLRRFDGDLFATGIVFCDKHKGHVEQWHSIPNAGMMTPFIVPVDLDYIHQYRYDEWKKGTELFSIEIPEHFIKQHFDAIFNLPSAQKVLKDLESNNTPMPEAPAWEIDYGASFKNGYILVSALQPFKSLEILPRFAKVFEQAYTRFLDLKNAEAQTREAQINLAVERVRAKALAMHKSEEIMGVVAKLKDEVMNLDIPDVVAATIFLNEGEDKVRMWDLSSIEVNDNQTEVPFDITFKFKKTDPHFYMKRVWENQEDYFVVIQDEKGFKRLIKWLRELNKSEVAEEVEKFLEKTQLKRLHHTVKKLNNGKLVIDLLNPPSDEMKPILTKMGAAFDLAYKRFEDLQKAEAQTREAQIEAALERVRSRSMAMHKSEELLDVISVVSEQLQQLNFKFIHVSFANNDISKDYKFWTSSKGMPKPMRFNVPYLDIPMFNNLRQAQEKSVSFYTDILTKEEHIEWHKHLLKHGGATVFSKEENEYIMSRGMARSIAINPNIILILANYASIPYSKKENKIIERFGQVFEQSYTRFLDLQKAEAQALQAEKDLIAIKAARKKAEEALTELQSTQKQLIQSEKMASLGELTAGIAHEIQNPLNFVNNFSEVSMELLDEMKSELENGNLEDVKELAQDVIENLEKINHHGKRADAIVKGMLQHSRSNSGTKESTDINALCDEYLRLSYHGLRAKDKAFNATLITNFEDGLKKVNVIPQDLGRVVLNLLTNAFYAVNERKQQNPTNYEPTVSIATKTVGKHLEIRIKDNGNGMPQEVVDKIFQPFFTTKPTGKGTGLGLSMSYDIITKGHGGDLKVETEQHEGTEFIISLPI